MQAIIFVGIQATGKTTFYYQHFMNSHVRISLDLLKTRHREIKFIDLCLETQQRFVVDNTNPTINDRKRYIEKAKKFKFELTCYYFQSQIQSALERNKQRIESDKIPSKGILGTYNKLEMPSKSEGFDSIYYVKFSENGTFSIDGWTDEI